MTGKTLRSGNGHQLDATLSPGDWSTVCLNCASPLTGAFCAHCGQRAVPPHPTLRELAGDAFAELSGWDGKFVDTFRLLIRKPGELTRRYIDGMRARFISPVRLYLTMSLVYFVLASGAPNLNPRGTVDAGGIHVDITTAPPSAAKNVAGAVVEAREGAITAEQRAEALKQIEHAPRIMRPIFRKAINDPDGFKANILAGMPKVLFALLPVFAGIVALFYRRRHFPEHLYFALHLHAFVFLVLSVAQTAKYTRVTPFAFVVGLLAALTIPVYGLIALRRMYGGSIGGTMARAAGIAALYAVAGAAGLSALVAWASRGS